MKFNREKFLKTELGSNMIQCVVAWNRLLELETVPNLIGSIWNTLTKRHSMTWKRNFLQRIYKWK